MLKIKIDGMTALEEGKLRRRIAKQFKGAEYLGTTEIHVVNNFVFVEGKSQPYFRLRVFLGGNAAENFEDIEQRLEALNIKIEVHNL